MVLTKQHVASIFSHLASGDSASFFTNVSDDVNWLVTGSSHPLARSWDSKQEFFKESWGRIGGIMQKPAQLSIVSIIVEPQGEGLRGKAAVELRGEGGVLKNGKEYNNEYCWVVGFNEEGLIQSLRAYLDSAKLRDALEENE